MREFSVEKLVMEAKRGSREAYGELVRRYSRYIFAVCMGVLGDGHDAEDVAQEVLLKGFRQIGSLKEDGKFRQWMTKMAKNECVDYIRDKVKMRETAKNQDLQKSQARPCSNMEKLKEAILLLEEHYRLPLMLYYFEGKDCMNVAECLGEEVATIRTRLTRARNQLRAILSRKEWADE